MREEFIMLTLTSLSAWSLNCFDIEPSQEIIQRSMLKHLIDIDLLERHSGLKLHEDIVCKGI